MLNESNVAREVSGDILRQSGYRFTLQHYLIVSLLLHPLEAPTYATLPSTPRMLVLRDTKD
jgi:hypothetical protein